MWVTSDGVLTLGTPSTVVLGLGEAPRSVSRAWEVVKHWGNGGGSEASAWWVSVPKGLTGVGFS
jgi:hypothetical protein